MKKVLVYSTNTCHYCIMAKKYFAENNIPYENFDVSMNPDALGEMQKKSGQMGVPVIDIEGKIIVGFNKEAIARELGL